MNFHPETPRLLLNVHDQIGVLLAGTRLGAAWVASVPRFIS